MPLFSSDLLQLPQQVFEYLLSSQQEQLYHQFENLHLILDFKNLQHIIYFLSQRAPKICPSFYSGFHFALLCFQPCDGSRPSEPISQLFIELL
jgi:uncharacterized membrane protein